MERTFAIIKPDAVKNAVIGRILARIEQEGFRIVAMRLQHLSKREAEGFFYRFADRGRGLPKDFTIDKSDSLGMIMINATARQLGHGFSQ